MGINAVRILVPVLSSLVIGLLSVHVFTHNAEESKKNLSQDYVVVHLPKAYLWVGVISMLMCSALIIVAIVCQHNVFAEIVFALGFVLSAVVVELCLVWRIHVFKNENCFIIKTEFLNTYKLKYDECLSYKYKNNVIVLKASVNGRKKTFLMDPFSTNMEVFLSMLKKYKVKEIFN